MLKNLYNHFPLLLENIYSKILKYKYEYKYDVYIYLDIKNKFFPTEVLEDGTHIPDFSIIKEVYVLDRTSDIHCFSYYRNLEKIKLPKNLKYIKDSYFEGCSSLKNIFLPEGLISIGKRAFYGCSSLEKIIIPRNVKSIGEEVFHNCKNLKKIIILNDKFSIESF